MVRIGRIVLVALLVALIPAKGFAAARMLFCGVATDRVGMLVQGQHADHAVQAATPADAQPPCHAHLSGADEAPPAHEGSPSHEGSCSVCAVCSASTAIAGDAAMRPLGAAAPLDVPASTQHFVEHIPPTLDRPPLG